MYWINLIIFSGYTYFWFYFLDYPLENFIRNTISSYKNLSSEEFAVAMRLTFMCFLVNFLIKIRKSYVSLRKFINNEKTTNVISLTKMEEDRYKIDFTIDKKRGSIFIQKSTEYDNIEGIYTDDYYNCVTSEVRPFFTFKEDLVRPRDINKIHNREDTSLIVTYKNKEERTVITDEKIYERNDLEYDVLDEKIYERNDLEDDVLEENTDKTQNQMSEL